MSSTRTHSVLKNLVFLGPDNIPDATTSIEQVITPKKDERTYIVGQGLRMQLLTPVSVVREPEPITPYKQLQQAPSVLSESSEDTVGSKKRGETFTDPVKLAFLAAWIDYGEEPFGHTISKYKSTKVKLSIENIIK